jgi:hypothetical protein
MKLSNMTAFLSLLIFILLVSVSCQSKLAIYCTYHSLAYVLWLFFSNSNFCNFNLIKYSNSHNTKLVSLNLTLIEYIEVHVCEYTNSIEVRKLIIAILRVFHITICYSNGWFAQVAIEARNLVGVERVELPNPASMVTAYWQKMLPHSPMPTAILELLNPPTGISLSLSPWCYLRTNRIF